LNLKNFAPEGEGTSTYPNNSMYEGEWLNGEFHGMGKFSWPDGSEYDGEYYEGKKHGQGRFTYPSKKVYNGGWVNGKQEGEGRLYSQTGSLLKKGIWKDGLYTNSE
jgi:antitoxin component YwqK of YwqJK toxin-antitoxin module